MKLFKNIFTSIILMMSSIAVSQVTTTKSPNIIFFVVDDLGYFDLNCYGSDFYETPNIDQLATDGIRFTNGYEAAPRCAASRTSIMTGKFESRPSVSGGMYLPADNNAKGYSETTFAQALKDEGYKTFFIGKWHLGHDENHYPDSFGFDINIAGSDLGAPPTYWYPYSAKGKTLTDLSSGGKDGEYLTDRITDETNSFINNHVATKPNQPFLAMVSHYGVHTPLEAKSKDVSYFQNIADKDGYTGSEFENDLTAKTKLHQDNATYAAMIKSIDESLGNLRANLVAKGIADNTIIIVTSDNGGLSTTEIGGNRELPTSNRPLRAGKTWLYEGGIRLPLIVYGPKYRTGIVEDKPVVGTDFFPTMLEMAGVPLLPNQHLDGEGFQSLLLTKANGGDASFSRKNPIIWDFNFSSKGTANVSMAAIRQGDYKLLEFKYNNVFELYNVATDPGETTDLSASNPAKVEQLKTALFSYRSNAGITHRVNNSGHIATNQYLYNKMNTVTGSNVQADFGCAEPTVANDIIYNAGHECWYDLDWSLDVSASSEATITNSGPTEARTGKFGAHINIKNGGGFGKIKLINTPNYNNFKGGNLKLSVYAKSLNSNKFRFQIKVNYANNSNKTFLSTDFTSTSNYELYEHTFLTDLITSSATESIEVRVQIGKDNGDLYFDDWSGKITGISLSTPIFNTQNIAVFPNPASEYINISGPYIITKAYIFDISGKLIKKSIGDVERINVAKLPKGTYFMKAFVEGNQHFTKKILIK